MATVFFVRRVFYVSRWFFRLTPVRPQIDLLVNPQNATFGKTYFIRMYTFKHICEDEILIK